MRVKLLALVPCPAGSYQAGTEADLPDAIAMGLINGGYAVSLEVAKTPGEQVEEKKRPVRRRRDSGD